MGGVATQFKLASLEAVRALIASRFLDEANASPTLGSISLKPHQVSAITRIQDAIDEFGCAILCDPVGTGKTFTALAAVPSANAVLVVAPAVLREMWQSAAATACRKIEFVSYEALSRQAAPRKGFEFVIVDEAHHARNPSTTRYAELSRLVSGCSVVMLTATPIHNRRRDLMSLLRLVMGDGANRLSQLHLSRCVIRREGLTRELAIPVQLETKWHALIANDDLPQLILSLPPPVPPSDGGDGGALVAHGLIRQWASSDAALRGALTRRLVRGTALLSALQDGTWPTKSELMHWIGGDDSVQLAFAGFLTANALRDARFIDVMKAHRDGIVELRAMLDADDSRDDERASIIDLVRREHPHERIVAFSAYSDTIDAMFKRLVRSARVAALTSTGGRVAGGRITRADAIAQFSPQSDRRVKTAEEIALLLTTDLLSEGVNLQNASVVIHLDLPWTPARLEQRLGRVARIGSRRSRVVSHAFRPPASAEKLVQIEAILQQKARVANDETDSRRDQEEIRALLAAWRRAFDHDDILSVAVVRASFAGLVALIDTPFGIRLVASIEHEMTDSPSIVLSVLQRCEGPEATADLNTVSRHVDCLLEWADSMSALDDVGDSDGGMGTRDKVLRHVDHAVQSARPHERAVAATLASDARERLRARISYHAELRLRNHVSNYIAHITWLRELRDMLPAGNPKSTANSTKIIAMIVAQRENALSRARER